jgi:hypothetical protein
MIPDSTTNFHPQIASFLRHYKLINCTTLRQATDLATSAPKLFVVQEINFLRKTFDKNANT